VINISPHARLELGRRLTEEVLAPLKLAFVGKDEIIDLMGVCLVGGENLFILGPPGTAKSALVQELARRIEGRVFDYLLTRFTEPNELFGPFDIRKLREGELVTNTEGMLPEASFVFLDELLNANSAILNSLLMVLNERVFRRGRETRQVPTLMFVGASNRLPEDDALAALFDRFLMRVRCDNLPDERLGDVLSAGWRLDMGHLERGTALDVESIRQLNAMLGYVDIAEVRPQYIALVRRLRQAGIPVSDRRAVKLQRLVAASALLCGRMQANATDLWVLRYIWDTEEQQEVLAALVQAALDKCDQATLADSHPQARNGAGPDAETLARDLERIAERVKSAIVPPAERSVLRDQLGLLAARCQWIGDAQRRTYLERQVEALWPSLGER
jgi:MoxR-like ATPase